MTYIFKQWLVLTAFLALLPACPNDLAGGQVPCAEDNHCSIGEICGTDGYCTSTENVRDNGCVTNTDCTEGICENGICTSDVGVDVGSVLFLEPGNELDFGSPALGVAIEKSLIVKNVGQAAYSVLDVRLGADTSDEFEIEIANTGPWVIEVGGQLDIKVRYTLADGEEDLGSLLLTTTAERCEPGCENPAALSVDFFSEFKGERNLGISPPSIDFGYVGIGESSAPETVTLSNDGTLDKILTVYSIEVTGATDAFQYTLPSTPLYIFPGQGVPVEFVYAPTDCDDHILTLTVSANSDSPDKETLTATLSATAPPPNPLVFDPPTLLFSDLPVGESETLSSSLKSVGCDAVTLTSGQMASGAFQPFTANLAGSLPYVLQPGASIGVNVTYTPNQAGTNVDTYQVYAQGFSDPVTLPVAGQNYVPPSISVVMGPERLQTESNCMCTPAGDLPAANVDLSYRVSPNGATCAKPSNPSCGIGGGSCDCNLGAYGNATWRAYTEAQVGSELWVIDEEVVHDGPGEAADFVVKANLLDDCLLGTGGASYTILANCCIFDCEGTSGTEGNRACFDYSQFNVCANDCPFYSSQATSSRCMKRGPVPIRTTVKIPSDGSEGARVFCATLSGAGATKDIITVSKTQTSMTITQMPGVTEISPGQTCPQ
ncbi:MAG: hypothetical protein CMH56_03210 [Myxococcales bacterium]|nr:hypothetical protein [Myxococcales bacterium]